MIKFDWKKINDKLDWEAISVLQYFFIKQNIEFPRYLPRKLEYKVKKLAKKPYPKGACYLLNVDDALVNATSLNDIFIYLQLASKRNKFDLHMRGVKYLPAIVLEEYEKARVKTNPMLKLENDKVYFKYEQE